MRGGVLAVLGEHEALRCMVDAMPPEPTVAWSLVKPLKEVPGVTARMVEGLVGLGITNVGRLLAHLPMRHERHEAESTIAELAADHIVSARGEVSATRVNMRGPRPRFEAVLTDDTGRLDLVWFNQPFLRHNIAPGMRLRVQGKSRRFGPGGMHLQIANPQFEVLSPEGDGPGQRQARLRPVYPASERINSQAIERVVGLVLPHALGLIEDHLPPEYRDERTLVELREAYRMQHAPKDMDEVERSHRRLAFDEFLLLQLGVHLRRAQLRERLKAPALKHTPEIDRRIRSRFPFPLTPSQDAVVADIVADLSAGVPTNRLIQGDVGSGKTVVALYAMLMAVASEQQAALMAPTEILAEQHFANIQKMLEGSQVKIALLTGSVRGPERDAVLAGLAAGEIDLIIGTHALLTEQVKFRTLAVAIIDEQHRFGVAQRSLLRGKAEDEHSTPHVLVMTATPIPRTLAITLFGDLDISVIRGLPPGRKPVKTRVVMEGAGLAQVNGGVGGSGGGGEVGADDVRREVYAFVRTRLEKGQQAYVVVPAIDTGMSAGIEGEASQAAALRDVRALMKELEEGPLQGFTLAAMHGRLKNQTRDRIMHRFRAGQIHALVATTVIEVGVDVPNATVMVVEHADRFGLAQLHQLRGRVGRGDAASVCVLIGDARTAQAEQRLSVMEESHDGFVLAEKDFEIRGPGELLGTRQSGLPPFRVADLVRDRALLDMARRDAAAWIRRSPGLLKPEEATLRRRLLKTYGDSLGLADVG